VEFHHTKFPQRRQLFRNDLGWVQNVETERKRLVLVDDLDSEFPFGIVTRGDGVEQITTVSISILASKGLSFLPVETSSALLRLPVPFDKF
jgi:hypothetical protein